MKKISKLFLALITSTSLLILSTQVSAWGPRGQAPYPFPCEPGEKNCHLKNLWITVAGEGLILSDGKEVDHKSLEKIVRDILEAYPKKYRILFDSDLDRVGGYPMSANYSGDLNENNTLRISVLINVTKSITPVYAALNVTFRDGGVDYKWLSDFRPYIIRLNDNFVPDISRALECDIAHRLYEEVYRDRVKAMSGADYMNYCD